MQDPSRGGFQKALRSAKLPRIVSVQHIAPYKAEKLLLTDGPSICSTGAEANVGTDPAGSSRQLPAEVSISRSLK